MGEYKSDIRFHIIYTLDNRVYYNNAKLANQGYTSCSTQCRIYCSNQHFSNIRKYLIDKYLLTIP